MCFFETNKLNHTFASQVGSGGCNVRVGVDDLMSDADTEEALAEFDFLVSASRDGSGETRSANWGKGKCCRVFILYTRGT